MLSLKGRMPKLVRASKLRVLDFDIENRPLSYLGQDFTTAEITSIAASFVGERKIYTWLLGVDDMQDILEDFRYLYDSADIVTGHYIRRHDLPIISGMILEEQLAPLGPKLTSDTKLDLKTAQGISLSQENLSETFGLRAPKVRMNTPKWRAANRLTPEGIVLTRKRVEGDIVQHKQLRKRLIELNMLNSPVLWKP
jgi:hypothetical protein